MSVNTTRTGGSSGTRHATVTAELLDQLGRFDGPPELFLPALLAAQCQIAGAQAGAILRAAAGGKVEIIAVHPALEPQATAPVWLANAAAAGGKAMASGTSALVALHEADDLYGHPARRHVIVLPLRSGGAVRGAAAYLVEASDPAALAHSQERLELSAGLLGLYEMRLTLQRRGADLQRLRGAFETLAAVNEQDRFVGAAMSFCNEVAGRWGAERVSLGFLRGRSVVCRAMSRTEKFSRRMQVVQDIEATMEECLDQDVEVLYPASEQATFIHRAAGELSGRHGPTAVLSLPLRRKGDPVAVLTVERPAEQPFTAEQVESLRLACDLCTARLVELKDRDRWFGARLASATGKGLGKLVGPRHAWLKVGAMAVLTGILLLVFLQGDYCAEGTFSLEFTEKQVVAAPFDGYLLTATVEKYDPVEKGKLLAQLDPGDLRLQLVAATAEQAGYLKQADAARGAGKIADAQIAQAQADAVEAKIELLQHRIRQSDIRAPIDGSVVTGDWKRQIGAPVKTGDVLFEIAPLASLHAELKIPEDQIADVRLNQPGELTLVGEPGKRVGFTIERIDKVATVSGQQNVFIVRGRLTDVPEGVRLDARSTGTGRVFLGRRSYAWLWTHRLIDWFRMKLWL